MSISKQGYKKNSPYKNRESLIIDSNVITTKDMAFPILATSDTGDSKILYPNTGEYVFNGTKVRETKVKEMKMKKQKGGLMDSIIPMPTESVYSKAVPYMDMVKGLPQVTNQKYTDMQTGKEPHISDMLFKQILPSEQEHTRVATKKFRYKEKQEGGEITLEDYLSSLSYEEQDKFIQGFEQAPNKEQYIAKCGGKFQNGGISFPTNANVEGGETILTQAGLEKIEGPRHSQGGVDVNLEQGDKVFSDYLIAPKEVIKSVLGKNSKAKMTFADLSKKFDTEKELKVLEDPDSDKYQTKRAEMMLNNKQAMLETIFSAQEMSKETKPNLEKNYKKGGMFTNTYQAGGENLSDISYRFKPKEDGSLYDPKTGYLYTRDSQSGKYYKIGNIGTPKEQRFNTPLMDGFNATNPTNEVQRAVSVNPISNPTPTPNPTVNGRVPEQFIYPWPKYPEGKGSENNGYGEIFTFPDDKGSQGLSNGLPQGWVKGKSNIRQEAENKVKGKSNPPQVSSKTNVPSRTVTNLPSVLSEDGTPPDMNAITELGDFTQNNWQPNVGSFTPQDEPFDSSTIDTVSAKQSWWNKNKDKFGINSKLAGTILDVGLVLSDKVRVNNPMLYDHQKNPLFNRFYEFDNKEVQRLADRQIQGIMNSNMPEQVKQSQIAAIMGQAQDQQAKVDFANAQRYENKRDTDTQKLQSYQDMNVDARISDFDNWRQRKAKVDFLKDSFKAKQKEQIANSAKGYLDYVNELSVANDLSPYFEINPITGKTKYKPQSKSNLQDNLISQYAQNSQNTKALPNGAFLTQVGEHLFIIDADGKSQQVKTNK